MSSTRLRLEDLPARHQEDARRQLASTPRPRTIRMEPVDIELAETAVKVVAAFNSVFIVAIEPMGAPRMTQRDKWAKRPVVVAYHAYADRLRAACGGRPENPATVSWRAFFTMPASWSKAKKKAHAGQPHRAKPDRDNIDKGVLDSLWEQDCGIASGTLAKFWDDGRGARLEITAQ